MFASFAPATSPRFAVDAVFEQSGYGASSQRPPWPRSTRRLFGLNKPAQQGACTSPSSSTSTTTVYGSTSSTTSTSAPGPLPDDDRHDGEPWQWHDDLANGGATG